MSRLPSHRRLLGMLALTVGAYGCRLILGVGDVSERSERAESDGGGGIAVEAGPLDGAAEGGPRDSGLTSDAQPRACATTWCWENPLPQGENLGAVWANSPNDIWAVGDRGATLHINGETFDVRTTRTTSTQLPQVRFTKVWANTPNDAFGLLHAQPSSSPPTLQIWRHLDGGWQPIAPELQGPQPSSDLWGLASGDVWASAFSEMPPPPRSVVLRRGLGQDGAFVESMLDDAGPAAPFVNAIRGTAPDDVWAAAPGRLAHWTGAWETKSCGVVLGIPEAECSGTSRLVGSGPGQTGPLHLVTTGSAGARLFRWNKPNWDSVTAAPAFTGSVRDIAATAEDIWLLVESFVAPTKFVRIRDGVVEAAQELPGVYTAFAAYGTGQLIAVGERGALARLEGGLWKAWPKTGGSYATINDLCVKDGLVLGVGNTETGAYVLVHREGGLFVETELPSGSQEPQSCWIAGKTDVWVAAGSIYRWNGTKLEVSYSADAGLGSIRQLRGSGPKDIWAVGFEGGSGLPKGFAMHFDGEAWKTKTPPGAVPMFGLWIDTSVVPAEAWAVGRAGAVYRYREDAWTRVDPSPSSADLRAIGGTSSSDVWVTGGFSGTDFVWRYNGQKWTPYPQPAGSPPGSSWKSLVAGAPNDAWVASANGDQIAAWNGTSWVLKTNVVARLSSLAFDSDGTLWAAGERGAIVRYGR